MQKLKVGDVCVIVDIHKKDGFFEDKRRLVGKKVKIERISPLVKEGGFRAFDIVFQEKTRGGAMFRKGEGCTFFAVKLKKVSK